MKAKIRKTGEIVNIAEYAKIALDQCDSWGNPREMKPEEVELIQEQTEDEHWQGVRIQAAIAAMQGTVTTLGSSDICASEIAQFAVACADAIVEQLKRNNYGNN